MNNPSIIPITRNNKFFSQADYNLQVRMGREVIEGQGNFTVILYKVDRVASESDDVYGEATKNGIKFHPPIELKVVPMLEKGENKSMNKNGTGRFLEDGKLTFSIYEEQLTELNTTISFGDYIGYAVNETTIRYYSVSDDGVKNFDNPHTIMGYKSAFRTVVCGPVDQTEFNAI